LHVAVEEFVHLAAIQNNDFNYQVKLKKRIRLYFHFILSGKLSNYYRKKFAGQNI